jgi:hypothetical protein
MGTSNTGPVPTPPQHTDLKPLDKLIFVGSSSADRELASQVTGCLSKIPNVKGKCWTEEFPLGLLTFEALERMLRTCAGAVFIVASVDDRGRPNENIMIEVGLVAGRMGRTRVALCTNGSVHLPSDLAAVTKIENMLAPPNSPLPGTEETASIRGTISTLAAERLRDWATTLPAMLQGVPCTQVLHDYSGHWQVVLDFEKWRTKVVGSGFAGLSAEVLLHIPCNGLAGSGILVGKLTLRWKPDGDRKELYTGLFHACSSISDVTCQAHGSMMLRTQTLMRQAILQTGDPSPGDALPSELAGPWIFRWDLKPSELDPGMMEVKFHTDFRSDWSEGKGSAYRSSANSWW